MRSNEYSRLEILTLFYQYDFFHFRLDEHYLPCLHSVYAQSEPIGVHNTDVINLICPVHMTNSSAGNLRPRSANFNKQLNKPILLVTFYTRPLGNSTFETVLSFPQAGQFEIDVTLASSTVEGSSLKVASNFIHSSIKTHKIKYLFFLRDGGRYLSSAWYSEKILWRTNHFTNQ